MRGEYRFEHGCFLKGGGYGQYGPLRPLLRGSVGWARGARWGPLPVGVPPPPPHPPHQRTTSAPHKSHS